MSETTESPPVLSQNYAPDFSDDSSDVKEKVSAASQLPFFMGESTPENGIALGQQNETNNSNDWIDVLGNGLLTKKTVKSGLGVSTRPSMQSRVKMRIRGMLSNGKIIDKHNSFIFTVGDNEIIQAIDLVTVLMQIGEICQIRTDSKYAYGQIGRSPDIPPNSTLLYELELLEIKPPLDVSTVSEKDLLAYLNKKRGRGNDLFQRKEFSQAVISYSRAVETIRSYKEQNNIRELSSELSDLWIRCLNNLAAAQLKVEMYDEALRSAQEVLKADPVNVKALYRCGKVYLIKGDLDEAVENLQKATDLSPDEKAIHAELVKAIRKRDQDKAEEKALYKRMMDGSRSKSTGANTTTSSLTRNSTNSLNWGLLVGAGILVVIAVGAVAVMSKYKK